MNLTTPAPRQHQHPQQLYSHHHCPVATAADSSRIHRRSLALGDVGWPLPLSFFVKKGEVTRRNNGDKFASFSIDVEYRVGLNARINLSRPLAVASAQLETSGSPPAIATASLSAGRCDNEKESVSTATSRSNSPTRGRRPSHQQEVTEGSVEHQRSSSTYFSPQTDSRGSAAAAAAGRPSTSSSNLSTSSHHIPYYSAFGPPASNITPSPSSVCSSARSSFTSESRQSPQPATAASRPSATGSSQRRSYHSNERDTSSTVLKWTIVKRFSECQALHAALQLKYPQVPYFPPRTLFRLFDTAHMETRRQKLHDYLNGLKESREIMCDPRFREFCELPPHVEEVDRKARMEIYGHRNYNPVKIAETRDEQFGCKHAFLDERTGLLTAVSCDFSLASKNDVQRATFRLPWEPQVDLYAASRVAFWQACDLYGSGGLTASIDGSSTAKRTVLLAEKTFTSTLRAVSHGMFEDALYLFISLSDNRTIMLKVRQAVPLSSSTACAATAAGSGASLSSNSSQSPPAPVALSAASPLASQAVAAPEAIGRSISPNSSNSMNSLVLPERTVTDGLFSCAQPTARVTTQINALASSVSRQSTENTSTSNKFLDNRFNPFRYAKFSYFSRGEDVAVTCGCPGGASICEGLDLKPNFRIECAVVSNASSATALAFAPSSCTLFVGRRDGRVFGIDVEEGQNRAYFATQSPVNCLRVCETSIMSLLYVGCENGKVYVCDSSSSELLETFCEQSLVAPSNVSLSFGYPVTVVAATYFVRRTKQSALANKDSAAATATSGSTAAAAKQSTPRERLEHSEEEEEEDEEEEETDEDFAMLASVNAGRIMCCWEMSGIGVDMSKVAGQRMLCVLPTPRRITSLDLTPGGDFIFCGEESGNVSILRVMGGRTYPIYVWSAHVSAITRLRWIDNGSVLLTASQDGYVRIWAFPLTGPESPVAVS